MKPLPCYFETISDPRVERSKKHHLLDIIIITLCGILAGADGWDAIYDFAVIKKDWLKKFLSLKNDIPSSDTIRRVISRIKPTEFESSFSLWVSDIAGKINGIVSIDGKTIKNKRIKNPLHLVSAWSNQNSGICLGQIATEDKSNEIVAIPKLLDFLDINGCIVTIDAIGCQKKIAQKIIDGGGDYCLSVKKNQPKLYKQIEDFFSIADGSIMGNVKQTYEKNLGHGREEVRMAYLSQKRKEVPALSAWPQAKQFGMILSKRIVKDQISIQKRYFIMSSTVSAKQFISITRAHWGIENKLHWHLDVTFREDGNRIQKDHGGQNLAMFRKIAINLLNKQNSKISMKRRMFMMALDSDYMEKVLMLL